MPKSPLNVESLTSDNYEPLESSPNKKTTLSSSFGKIIERATYVDLIIAAFLAIFSSSILIWVIGSLKPNANYLDTLYFCFVTFTTLGYGDYAPTGFARLISVFLTLSGLLFTTLLIGKFASERHQAILLLLHTSDCQRRIDTFCDEISRLNSELRDAFSSQNTEQMIDILKALTSRFEASSNYVIFHANQSNLTEFGNDSVLIKYYKAISDIQETCHLLHTQKNKLLDEFVFIRSMALARRACSLISIMYKIHQRSMKNYGYTDAILISIKNRLDIKHTQGNSQPNFPSYNEKIRTFIFEKIKTAMADKEYNANDSLLVNIRDIKSLMQERLRKIISSQKEIINPQLLNEVLELMPEGEKISWGQGIHKVIAAELKTTNKLAQECIDVLIEQKRLPKLPQ